jgi:hypothetical protein
VKDLTSRSDDDRADRHLAARGGAFGRDHGVMHRIVGIERHAAFLA